MQTDNFSISFLRNGERQAVNVVIEASTDDVDTYVCYVGNERISQIRKDGQQWKQLWGDLGQFEVDGLGEQIEEVLAK